MAAVTGTFTATGQSSAFQPIIRDRSWGQFNLELRGTFVATVQLERSFNGTDWVSCTNLGTGVAFNGPVSEVCEENERGATFRLNCTAYTSGTVTYRLSQ